MLFAHRHNLAPDGVGGTVERDGQAELHGLIGQLPDLRRQANG